MNDAKVLEAGRAEACARKTERFEVRRLDAPMGCGHEETEDPEDRKR